MRIVWPAAVFHHREEESMNTTWTEWLVRIAFFVSGTIHVLPVAGLLGRGMLERAYGVHLGEGQDLVILLQHRAILFGLIACACFVAIGVLSWRWPAGIAALVSMLTFALIAAMQTHGAAISKVMWIDVAASLVLIIGLTLHFKFSEIQ
jgi:hypothetical protein